MDIYLWVKGGFERFENCWEVDDFWKRGNTFHAFLRFVDAAERKWPSDPIVKKMSSLRQDIIQKNDAYFKSESDKSWWADDYGWWGMACLTAYNYLLRSNDRVSAATYLAYARKCWEKMLQHGYDASDTARPVPHGCANSGSPSENGTKNTVTNANLFLLSLRLYSALKNIDPNVAGSYLKMAYAQYLWFYTWFVSSYGYLRVFPGPYGLLQERPIAPPDYEHKDHPKWEPGWVWTGDQGLILAALAETYLLRDDLSAIVGQDLNANDILNTFTTISTGLSMLFGAKDKILREAPFNSSFSDDPNDYVAGRGVLLRYVSEASVREVMKSPYYPDGIAATAQAVWASRDQSNNQFHAGWTTGSDTGFNETFRKAWGQGDVDVVWPESQAGMFDGVKQANGLDVLTAALLTAK
jgi:hypothetical protein